MSRIRFVLILSVLYTCVHITASAQVPVTAHKSTEPKPVMIRSSLDPEAGAYLGQKVSLHIEVMTNTWFTKAPQYPELRIPHAICLELSQFGTNYTERIQGETYAIQRKEYVIYPQRAERYAVPSLSVDIVYARPGESPGKVTLSSAPLEFEARIPEQAQGVDFFVSTPKLQVQEQYDHIFDEMKVGDSVTRTITMTADDSVGMMLPPLEFGKIEGMAVYPKTPRTEDTGDRGEYTGTRIESVTYLMEEEGDYVLPEIKIFWFDLRSDTLRVEILGAVEFSVAANPELDAEMLAFLEEETGTEEEVTSSLKRRIDVKNLLYLALAIMGVSAALWIFLFPFVKKTRAWWKQHRQLKAESEEAHFRHFRNACRSGDAHQVMQSFLSWLDKIYTGPGAATVEGFVQLADDMVLQALAAGLKEELYGKSEGDEGYSQWQAVDFYNSVAKARKRLFKTEAAHTKPAGLQPLNP
ncbi:MAG: hypothetical protein GQ544_02475 [Candidatus Aminicenantes bacterium]|nr:hypothetical protein [Candidatus Aminicenantes bacterium]